MNTSTENAAKPRRRWFRFSLRTLLIVMILFAVWCGNASYKAQRQKRALEALGKLDLRIHFDYQKRGSGGYSTKSQLPGPEWLSRLIGEDYFRDVVEVSTAFGGPMSSEGMVHLAALPNIESLYLNESNISDSSLQYVQGLSGITMLTLRDNEISDAGLSHLTGLNRLETLGLSKNRIEGDGLQFLGGKTKLRSLFLYDNPINDVGLSHIANIPNLEMLGLSRTLITDNGTKHLVHLSKLKYLSLNCEAISDASIECLIKMPSLQELELSNTKITPDGFERLRKAIPSCNINGKRGDGKAIEQKPFP
ncbi:MAG: hypothetical protein R3C10_21880 [Pirellulales bacterium]